MHDVVGAHAAGASAEDTHDAGEAEDTAEGDAEAAPAEGDHAESEVPHWSYAGDTGPDHWGELEADYALCATGEAQSPVLLIAGTEEDIPDIVFNYAASPLTLADNGHSVEVSVEPGSSIEIDGVTYTLLQYHFHAPSEHAINGVFYPMEMHLVHQAEDGTLAVVGVMIDLGDASEAYAPFFDALADVSTAAQTVEGVSINPADLLPAEPVAYRYAGSLTTPPCSEGVVWSVLANPVTASAEQIAAFEALYDGNARPIQPGNERAIVLDTTID
ncbi:MAG: carbonic anhydrase family protein [Anaerolineae bacterium]|nr:carbonic anhydrase family protein [Anaerolineae bacterium]